MAHTMVLNHLRTLLNTDLKEICKREGLAVSGVKAVLQDRIQSHLEDAISRRDQATVDRVQHRILHRGASPDRQARPTMPTAHQPAQQQGQPYRVSLPNPAQRTPIPTPVRLNFKPSPFYHIVEPLSQIANLEEMPQNRSTMSMSLTLSESQCESLRADPQRRVMLYCTTASLIASYEQSDVAFPGNIEVKLNQEDVKSNYKGLKNKPGTTKPADLTNLLRKQPRYPNNLQINYALTTKRYSVIINMVRKATPEELVKKIQNVITKEQVLAKMATRAQDTDIEATSIVLSLKDPVSTMRMDLPCRSTVCTHNQCFDALCFLQLQEQAPTWTCPICNKTISHAALAIDNYVLDILQNTAKSVDQVTIEPLGEWKELRQNDEEEKSNQPRASYDDDSDDDLIEIDSATGVPLRPLPSGTSTTTQQHMTPPLSSRETSVAQNGRNKRPSAVIDLTLSDEDEPPRPAKRTHVSATTYHTPSSNSDRSQDAAQRPAPQQLPAPQQTTPTIYSGFAPMQSPRSLHGASPRPADAQQQQQQQPSQPPAGSRMPAWPPNYAPYNSSSWSNGRY